MAPVRLIVVDLNSGPALDLAEEAGRRPLEPTTRIEE